MIQAADYQGNCREVHPFGAIIIGLIAGWIAGKLMRGRGYGILADIVLGLIGAIIGNWMFTRLGIETTGALGFLAMATVGAVLLVGAAHLLGAERYS